MTYATILSICVFVTAFALWRWNILMAIVASAAWAGLLAIHLANPPANVTAGSPADTAIVLALVGMILAVPIITLQNMKAKKYPGDRGDSSGGQGPQPERTGGGFQSRGIMDMSPEEYKLYLRRRVNRGRK